jgi:hypothetical protein
MVGNGIGQVSVWLDESAPSRGAFAQALEWGSRLGLSLRVCVPAEERWRRLPADGEPQTYRPQAELLAACEAACTSLNVPAEHVLLEGTGARGVEQFLRPATLCVFGSALSDTAKVELMRQSLRNAALPFLVCPQTSWALSRVLVVHQGGASGNCFLESAARLCGALPIAVVVLTVAGSEREAAAAESAARAVWAARGPAAEFDVAIGCELRGAVASVAQWRRCTHLFVERQRTSPWRRWLRRDAFARLLGLSDSLSVLALPAAAEVRSQRSEVRGQRSEVREPTTQPLTSDL